MRPGLVCSSRGGYRIEPDVDAFCNAEAKVLQRECHELCRARAVFLSGSANRANGVDAFPCHWRVVDDSVGHGRARSPRTVFVRECRAFRDAESPRELRYADLVNEFRELHGRDL